MTSQPKTKRPDVAALIAAHVPAHLRELVAEEIADGGPWSFRGGVLRVGDTDPMSGDPSWYYRGAFVGFDTGFLKSRYSEPGGIFAGAAKFDRISDFKRTIDERLAPTPIREPLEDVRARGSVRRAAHDRRCDACGVGAIPAGSRYWLSRAEVRAYRSAADAGSTHRDFRFCATCHPLPAKEA